MILSASQIESFQDDNPFGCQARWWFEKIDPKRVKVEKDNALAIGDAVHKTLESFLKGAEQGVLHDIVIGARGALEFLIALRKRIKHVELEFGPTIGEHSDPKNLPMIRLGGIDVRGKIDWIAFNGDDLELGDHKTTSNIARYAKTPGQIKKSTQMNIYARWFARNVWDFSELKVTQDFYQTKKGKKFDVQSTTISKLENDSRILSIEATVELMVKASTQTDPINLTPNFNACHIGYGCPHRAYCPHLKSQGVFDMASLFEAFAGLPASVAVPGAPAVPTPPAQVVVFPKVEAGAVLAPDAPKSNPVEAARKLVIHDEPAAPAETPAPVVAPAPAAPEPKKPGRPPGSANKPKAAKAATQAEISQMQSTAVARNVPGGVTIKQITIRHDAKIGLPGYSSAQVGVELMATLEPGTSIEEARSALSFNVKSAMVKELEIYKPAPKADEPLKP